MNSQKHLIPEWAEQSAVMLTWPHKDTDWSENLTEVEKVYQQIVKEIALREQVLIVCNNQQHKSHITNLIDSNFINNCKFVIADSNDSWCRDHGPISILENSLPLLFDFQFNGWGKKYPASLDNEINKKVYDQNIFSSSMESVPIVLEGGSIETDGAGTLLTTENCLLNSNRNPDYSKQELEDELCQLFGVKQILWLKHGKLIGDDTDSHIDTLARFCNETTIAYCSCDKSDTEHYNELTAMRDELNRFKNIHDIPYQLVELPLPSPIFDQQGNRLPATYANFLIINNAVLVPTYEDSNDGVALQRLSLIFPDREIVGINCKPIIMQYGSLHCLTMQLPKGVLT